MKRILSLFLALATAFCLTFTVSAASYGEGGVSISFPDTTVVLTPDNLSQNKELLKAIGHNKTSLKSYMTENNICAMAVEEDTAAVRFVFKETESEFSREAGSLSLFGEKALATLNAELCGGKAEAVTVGKTA